MQAPHTFFLAVVDGPQNPRKVSPGPCGERGAALIYFIGVIVVFSVIGAAMVSMFSSSMTSLYTPNVAKRAEYAAEAGMRYALSELRNAPVGALANTINTLNNTGTFTLANGDTFQLAVTPTWFVSTNSSLVNPVNTFNLDLPAGEFTPEYWTALLQAVTDGVYGTPVHSVDGYAGNHQIAGLTQVDTDTMTVNLATGTTVFLDLNEHFYLSATAPTSQTVSSGGSLTIGPAGELFPTENGVISINGMEYVFEDKIDAGGGNFQLTNLRGTSNNTGQTPFPISITAGNPVPDLNTKIVNNSAYNQNVLIQATGTAGLGGGQADRLMTRQTLVANNSFMNLNPDISFEDDMPDFMDPIVTDPDAIVPNETEKQIDIGHMDYTEFGAIWYDGDKYSENVGDPNSVGGCVDGECNFYHGLRIFFTFEYNQASRADGFTFTVMNAFNNDRQSVGGHWQHGEMMGYAGPSLMQSGACLDDNRCEGIEPPKMGVEFDNWFNTRHHTNYCSSNTRWDATEDLVTTDTGEDTVQFVFWGDDLNEPSVNSMLCGHESYDDNAHNVPRSLFPSEWGDGGAPTAATSNSPGRSRDSNDYLSMDDFSADYGDISWIGNHNWFNYGFWAGRLEIHRDHNQTNANGNYNYLLKFWLRPCYDEEDNGTQTPAANCTNVRGTFFENTRFNYEPYNHLSTEYLNRTVELTPTHHEQFNRMLFGWTEATGGATQSAVFRDFQLSFIRPGDSWVYYDPDW